MTTYIKSKFLTRAAGIQPGSMVNETGKLKQFGSHSLTMETPYGRWTIAIAGRKDGKDVGAATDILDDQTATLIYSAK